MNYNDLQEAVWRFLGNHDTANRVDWRRQEIRDAINMALDEIGTIAPFLWPLNRESTVSLVAGTATYTLDDWCQRALAFWTSDTSAHKIRYNNPRNADRNGMRNTNAAFGTLGPYDLTWAPRNTAAALAGAAASATEGGLTITGLTGLASTHVGRMIRLNGEDQDYKIVSISVTTATVDKKIKSRLTGLGTTGLGGNYSAVRWEIGPVGRLQIQILPTPTVTKTINYRFYALPRRLLNNDETPELPTEYHHLLWKGALRWITGFNEDQNNYSMFKAEYEQGIEMLKRQDQEDMDSEDSPHYDSTLDQYVGGLPVDVSFRTWPRIP